MLWPTNLEPGEHHGSPRRCIPQDARASQPFEASLFQLDKGHSCSSTSGACAKRTPSDCGQLRDLRNSHPTRFRNSTSLDNKLEVHHYSEFWSPYRHHPDRKHRRVERLLVDRLDRTCGTPPVANASGLPSIHADDYRRFFRTRRDLVQQRANPECTSSRYGSSWICFGFRFHTSPATDLLNSAANGDDIRTL
jgi:hypothetical protein